MDNAQFNAAVTHLRSLVSPYRAASVVLLTFADMIDSLLDTFEGQDMTEEQQKILQELSDEFQDVTDEVVERQGQGEFDEET